MSTIQIIAIAAGCVGILIFLAPAVSSRIQLNAGNYFGLILSAAEIVYGITGWRLVGISLLCVLLIGAVETAFIFRGARKRLTESKASWTSRDTGIDGAAASQRPDVADVAAVPRDTGIDGAAASQRSDVADVAAASRDTGIPAIVLGCSVRGTSPSTTLRERLEAAGRYHTAHPDALLILSGGKGSDEEISEAQCMFNYLTEHGVGPDRLIMEDRSTTTLENFENSLLLLKQADPALRSFDAGPSEKTCLQGVPVVIITSEFHEFRAQMIAKRVGIMAFSEPARTNLKLLPTYVVREWLAIIKLLAIGK